MSSTDTQGISDEQIDSLWLEHRPPGLSSEEQYRSARKFARAVLVLQPEPTVEQAIAYLKIALRDSKGWTMDYSDAIIRDAIDRVPEAAMEEMRTAKQMSAEYLQGFEDGASHIPPPDCDQAFEEKYKTSSRDPSNEGELAIWRDAWGAKGADALAAIKAAEAAQPVECTTCGALVVGVAPAWKDVRTDGLPPCDGETVYVGENEAGYMGCFNAYSDEACWMDTPEYTYNVMSGLRFWRVQDRPDAIRLLGEDAGREGDAALIASDAAIHEHFKRKGGHE